MTSRPLIMTAAEQVKYLRDRKDISFVLMSEIDAVEFLTDRNYFFKVKAFAKNFDKRQSDYKGRYINLDFGHLAELSRLDKKLRDLVLALTLDIEHNLKVRINRAAMRQGANPYELTKRYLKISNNNVLQDQLQRLDYDLAQDTLITVSRGLSDIYNPSKSEVIVLANNATAELVSITQSRNPDYVREAFMAMEISPYSKNVVRKYKDQPLPYWCLMELMSFGPMIAFYKACFKKEGLIADEEERAVLKETNNLLRRAKVLRNAAAHGDCLLNSLAEHQKDSSTSGVRKKLETYGLDANVVAQVATVRIAMDLAATLMCYDIIVPGGGTRADAASKLSGFASRMEQHKEWFIKNYAISSFMRFTGELNNTFYDVLNNKQPLH